jgi:hypothetical protein
LVIGASIALLRYAGWSAVYSARYGLPSETLLLKESATKADFYWWTLAGLGLAATIVTTTLLPPLKSDTLPPGIRGIGRFVVAVALVIGSIFMVAAGLSALGKFLK